MTPGDRAHFVDSQIFGHLWSTEVSKTTFGERERLRRWVRVIAALARAQAEVGIIPGSSAEAIGRLETIDVDIPEISRMTRSTSHSTLGLIHVLQEMLPESAREHVYFGATVQDITDTSAVLEMQVVGTAVRADLREVELLLMDMATQYRSTPMIGRTHGQPGAPISFGFKVASWLDELGRSIIRLDQIRDRVLVAQLGGAVGSLGFFGDRALQLRSAFAAQLGLREADISWLTARDRIAEFANVLSLACSALARMANEIYSLQRLELGELREATADSVVGSITMPHKRNPESSEQIVVLSRLVRSHAATLADTMIQEHERDARGWKAEWVLLPELCHYATAATALSLQLVAGLEVDTDVMRDNVLRVEYSGSEQLLRRLSPRLGKHLAQEFLHGVYQAVRSNPDDSNVESTLAALLVDADLPEDISSLVAEIGSGYAGPIDIGVAAEMTDRVVAASKARRAAESASWS